MRRGSRAGRGSSLEAEAGRSAAEEAKEEEPEAETVLSSTFIPRRIIQPRECGQNPDPLCGRYLY